MEHYTRPKTVRFEPKTWVLIEFDAAAGGVTTSEYIRDTIVEAVAGIEEAYLTEEFGLLGVKPHITHLKQDPCCAYSVVTVATPRYEQYRDLRTVLLEIYLEGAIARKTGSALDALVVKRFAEFGFGVAPCHAGDNFSRKRGRIIATGRLLKLLRKTLRQSIEYRDSAERLKRCI